MKEHVNYQQSAYQKLVQETRYFQIFPSIQNGRILEMCFQPFGEF